MPAVYVRVRRFVAPSTNRTVASAATAGSSSHHFGRAVLVASAAPYMSVSPPTPSSSNAARYAPSAATAPPSSTTIRAPSVNFTMQPAPSVNVSPDGTTMSSRTTTTRSSSQVSLCDIRPPTTDAPVFSTSTSTVERGVPVEPSRLVSVTHPSGSCVVSHSIGAPPSDVPTRSTPVAM